MLTTNIHADLTKYRPKIVGGLTARTLACIVLALATAVAIAAVAWLAFGAGADSVGIIIFVAVIPFWSIGFLEPDGMRFEHWLPLWMRHGRSRPVHQRRRTVSCRWKRQRPGP